MLKDGYFIPSNLDNHSAVRKVLLQHPGKLKASQLRKGMLLCLKEITELCTLDFCLFSYKKC